MAARPLSQGRSMMMNPTGEKNDRRSCCMFGIAYLNEFCAIHCGRVVQLVRVTEGETARNAWNLPHLGQSPCHRYEVMGPQSWAYHNLIPAVCQRRQWLTWQPMAPVSPLDQRGGSPGDLCGCKCIPDGDRQPMSPDAPGLSEAAKEASAGAHKETWRCPLREVAAQWKTSWAAQLLLR